MTQNNNSSFQDQNQRSFIIDKERKHRIGIPEAILCEGKSPEVLNELIVHLARTNPDMPYLFTRMSKAQWNTLEQQCASLLDISDALDYHALSKTMTMHDKGDKAMIPNQVAILTGGSSDLAAAWETKRTLNFMNVSADIFADIGVAGLWRLQQALPALDNYQVLIVCAGMEGALPTVAGGLLAQPMIALPISVGYGVSQGRHNALQSMLGSCAPGITVVNIDNGYGAASAAFRILQAIHKSSNTI